MLLPLFLLLLPTQAVIRIPSSFLNDKKDNSGDRDEQLPLQQDNASPQQFTSSRNCAHEDTTVTMPDLCTTMEDYDVMASIGSADDYEAENGYETIFDDWMQTAGKKTSNDGVSKKGIHLSSTTLSSSLSIIEQRMKTFIQYTKKAAETMNQFILFS